MKYIFLLIIIGLSLSYSPKAAILYARKYCSNYNPYYELYVNTGATDLASYVSQCLVAEALT